MTFKKGESNKQCKGKWINKVHKSLKFYCDFSVTLNSITIDAQDRILNSHNLKALWKNSSNNNSLCERNGKNNTYDTAYKICPTN